MKNNDFYSGSANEMLNDDGVLEGGTGAVDVHVGRRICARRKLLQMSQKQMAEKLGITFQQVQKYEKGMNRIGAGRLYSIAMILGVDVDYFYGELESVTPAQCAYDIGVNGAYLCEDESGDRLDSMYGAEAIMLLKSFYALPQRARTALLAMLSSLKDKDGTDSEI